MSSPIWSIFCWLVGLQDCTRCSRKYAQAYFQCLIHLLILKEHWVQRLCRWSHNHNVAHSSLAVGIFFCFLSMECWDIHLVRRSKYSMKHLADILTIVLHWTKPILHINQKLMNSTFGSFCFVSSEAQQKFV